MIAVVEGRVLSRDGNNVTILVGGIGYEITMCPDDIAHAQIEGELFLYIAENIKEDAHDLYGFLQKSKKELYLQLVSVNGVGPKAAMAILSVDNEDEIRRAIAGGDTGLLSKASGVGRKVAERVVVDLKNKVGLLESADATSFLRDDTIDDKDEAVLALIALGYSAIDAKFALSSIDKDLPTDKRVKEALRGR
jgi:holliday junction DNA helicase RuvA